MPFDPVDPRQSFPGLEEGILEYWRLEDTFKRSIAERGSGKTFSFYDGPPFATGLPHYGHLIGGTIKDVIPRYQTMRGHRVERRFGWDCHGLPVEYEIETEHKFRGKRDIEERVGVKGFNDLCRGIVQRYTAEWRKTVERMGRWVDMDFDYRTMDPEYMESVWWVFKTLYERGLIYEGLKPMHICTRCVTPLSNFEVTLGYRDREDLSVIATFPLVEDPTTILLAWTTTPWSLPGNFWLAIGPSISYVRVREAGGTTTFILAEKLVETVFHGRNYNIVGTVAAKDLLGKRYEPLFPYFVDTVLPSSQRAGKPETYGDRVFTVIMNSAVEVSDQEGTGIVHITSSTGEDSFAVAGYEGVDVLPHISMDGSFVAEVKDFTALKAKPVSGDPMSTDTSVIDHLRARGRHFSSFPITHSYPHCWRCDSPLLPYTTTSWFVAVEKIKKDLLASNARTQWVPDSVRTGRFHEWLTNAKDWCISRKRFWGCPIPIWRNEATGALEVIGSRDELMSKCPERFTKITIARHAESEGNVHLIYQGKMPGTDLTDLGVKQAEKLSDCLNEQRGTCNVATIYTSPLARTQQTAEIVGQALKIRPTTDERLRELTFGPYEGKHVDFNHARSREQRESKIAKRKVESVYHFEGMETWESVEVRLQSFLTEVLPKHRGEHILIVTHADPVMNFEHLFTGLPKYQVSHRPYPDLAGARTYYWDHETGAPMDLHRETVDSITWSTLRDAPARHPEVRGSSQASKERAGAPQGDVFQRIPEVLDCWFESGSMPYAQSHFPFESESTKHQVPSTKSPRATSNPSASLRASEQRATYPIGFPADFIAEGLDQTRGWFYTLMVLATALWKQPAFHHCIVNGIVLAEDGKKMSKRLKNYPEPREVIDRYGADALRFTLMSSPAVHGEELRFSEAKIEEALRSVLLPLWNTYSFFVTYATAARWEPSDSRTASQHPLDRWIRAEVQDLVNRMTEQLDVYDLSATCAELADSTDALTNWYVRLSRRRFAGKGAIRGTATDASTLEREQHDALQTLYDALLTLCKLLAPFCPFLTEAVYLNLVHESHSSIHLTDWPAVRKLTKEEQSMIRRNRILRTIVSLGMRVRSENKIKVRQPLSKAIVALSQQHAGVIGKAEQLQLMEELNVKELQLTDQPEKFVTVSAIVDPRKVGPRLGARVQEVIAAGKRGEFSVGKDGTIVILGEALSPDEARIVYVGKEGQNVAADRGFVVSLDTMLDEGLKSEGQARELIRAIQTMRRDAGMTVEQVATIQIEGADALMREHGDFILSETKSKIGKSRKARARITLELPDTYVTVSLL